MKHGAKVAVIRGTPEARGGNVIVRDLVAKTQRITRLAAVVTEVGQIHGDLVVVRQGDLLLGE